MKIDWKQLSKTAGYKSLKAAYVHDVQEAARSAARGHRPMRDKAEFLKHFRWVIARAKHYAHHRETTIEAILDLWESQRNYWWLNFYQDSSQPEFKGSRIPQPMGRRGVRNYYRQQRYSVKDTRIRNCKEIMRLQRVTSTKSPKRWDMEYKKRMARIKNL